MVVVKNCERRHASNNKKGGKMLYIPGENLAPASAVNPTTVKQGRAKYRIFLPPTKI
jgi:hypothetical protein